MVGQYVAGEDRDVRAHGNIAPMLPLLSSNKGNERGGAMDVQSFLREGKREKTFLCEKRAVRGFNLAKPIHGREEERQYSHNRGDKDIFERHNTQEGCTREREGGAHDHSELQFGKECMEDRQKDSESHSTRIGMKRLFASEAA